MFQADIEYFQLIIIQIALNMATRLFLTSVNTCLQLRSGFIVVSLEKQDAHIYTIANYGTQFQNPGYLDTDV